MLSPLSNMGRINFDFFYLELIFFLCVFLNCFNVFILKIFFKKKYYFNIF